MRGAWVKENEFIPLALYDANTGILLLASSRYIDVVARFHGLDPTTLPGRQWTELAMIATRPVEAAEIWNKVRTSQSPLHLREVHLPLSRGEQHAKGHPSGECP